VNEIKSDLLSDLLKIFVIGSRNHGAGFSARIMSRFIAGPACGKKQQDYNKARDKPVFHYTEVMINIVFHCVRVKMQPANITFRGRKKRDLRQPFISRIA
jgi:hypothetical protein